jgi:hypothetical protein
VRKFVAGPDAGGIASSRNAFNETRLVNAKARGDVGCSLFCAAQAIPGLTGRAFD